MSKNCILNTGEQAHNHVRVIRVTKDLTRRIKLYRNPRSSHKRQTRWLWEIVPDPISWGKSKPSARLGYQTPQGPPGATGRSGLA